MESTVMTQEEVVRQYALGLCTLDLSKFALLLHPNFKFVYRLRNDMGHGITTDVWYIGHMYKTFLEMKEKGLTIHADFCNVEVNGLTYFSIKLTPTHYRAIIYPMDYKKNEDCRGNIPNGEVLLFAHVKDGLLRKVECYTRESDFNWQVQGQVEAIKWGNPLVLLV